MKDVKKLTAGVRDLLQLHKKTGEIAGFYQTVFRFKAN
jgi:hypothetical protein